MMKFNLQVAMTSFCVKFFCHDFTQFYYFASNLYRNHVAINHLANNNSMTP